MSLLATGIAVDAAIQGAKGLSALVSRIKSGNVASLTEYTKDTNITMRMYVEESLVNEEIMESVTMFLNQLCAGYVITALNLQSYISSTKTVKDLLKVVSTEAYVDAVQVISEEFGSIDPDSKVISVEAGSIELDSKSQKLFAGRVLEFKMNVVGDDGKSKEISMIVYVQLIPLILSSEVIKGFISLNLQLPPNIRRLQAKAGLLRYVKDYIMAVDLVKKEKELVLKDKSGTLARMVANKNNAIGKWAMNNIDSIANGSSKNVNSANSIVIMDKVTFEEACKKQHINFENAAVRNKFFKESFAMMLVVVDNMYNLVRIYFCGLPNYGEYTFNGISKAVNQQHSNNDLKDIISSLARSNAPRY